VTATCSSDGDKNLLYRRVNVTCLIYLSQTGNDVSQLIRPLVHSTRDSLKVKSNTEESERRDQRDMIALGKLSSVDFYQYWPLRKTNL